MTSEERLELYEEALLHIVAWSEAYPLSVFPEPSADDWKRAREALQGVITLDRISGSCMRHVIIEVGKIARNALEAPRQ
jgi:hypothetical protein